MQEKGSLTNEPKQTWRHGWCMKGAGLGELLFKPVRISLSTTSKSSRFDFKHYEQLKTFNYYLNSKFESGDTNDDGSERFFHNIISHRCSQTTKNIDLDTDMYLKGAKEKGLCCFYHPPRCYTKWMRDKTSLNSLIRYPRSSHSLVLLFGSVVCVPVMKNTTLKPLILRTFLFLISFWSIPWSAWTILRSLLSAYWWNVQDVMRKADDGVWDADACRTVIAAQSGNVRRSKYIQDVSTADIGAFS